MAFVLAYPGLLVIPPGGVCSLGPQLVDWAEQLLCHGPGDVEGQPYQVSDDFVQFLTLVYALDKNGHRIVHRAVRSRPKGYAKSEGAGAIALMEAVGPVRFSHWAKAGEVSAWGYEYEEGEPVGKPVRSPFIRCLATEETQAGNTYDNVVVMGQKSELPNHYQLDVGLTRTFIKTGNGGEIRPSTASSSSKDGGRETHACADESHLYILPSTKAMHRTVSRNLAKRREAEPWILETTTMYQPGEDSVAETAHRLALDIQAGKTPNRGFLFDHREGPDVADWQSDKQVLAALKSAYGGAPHINVEQMLFDIRQPEASEAESRRYFLNQATSTANAFVDVRVWDEAARSDAKLEPGDPICLGFDGGQSDDNTGIVAERLTDRCLFRLGLWAPDQIDGEWRVPRAQVTGRMREIHKLYKVKFLFADPPWWHSELEEWDNELKTVVKFETNQGKKMGAALDRLHTDLVGLQVVHDGDPILTAQVLNAQRKSSGRGSHLAIGKPSHERKIDLAVAATLAHEAAAYAIAEGWPDNERKSVFAY